MQDAASELLQLQREYFAIYDEWLAADLAEVADADDDTVLKYVTKSVGSGLYCVLDGISMTAFEYRLAQFTQAIERFWVTNINRARHLAQSFHGWHAQLPYNDYLPSLVATTKRLGSYFDTIFVFDGLSLWSRINLRDDTARELFRANFRRAAMMQKLRPLAMLEVKPPVVVILNSDDFVPRGDSTDALVNEFFSQAFGEQWRFTGDLRETFDVMCRRGAETVLADASSSPLFRETLSDLDHDARFRKTAVGNFMAWQKRRLSTLPPDQQLIMFLWESHVLLAVTFEYHSAASIIGADSIVGGARWRIYRWLIEHDARIGPRSPEQEQVAAMALTGPKLAFIERLSVPELIKLREDDRLSAIRAAMTLERSAIKTATYENFSQIAERAASRLLDAITAFHEESAATLAALRRRPVKDVVSVAGGVALGVASAVVPELGIPAIVYGTLVGSQSVRGLLQNQRDLTNVREAQNTHPLGILYRLQQKAG